jgi:hypothetical protein
MWIVWDFTDKTCALPSWLHINMKGTPTFFTALGTPTTMNRLLSMIWGLRESCCGRFAARIWATIHYEKTGCFPRGATTKPGVD